jgi:hypothetical protein
MGLHDKRELPEGNALFGSCKDRWLRYNISLFDYNFAGGIGFETEFSEKYLVTVNFA